MIIAFLFSLIANAQDGTSTVISHSDVSVTTSTTAVAAANSERNYLLIQNKGSVDIYCNAGSAASGTTGIKLIAGGNWEPYVVPRQAINCLSSSGTQTVSVLQGRKP